MKRFYRAFFRAEDDAGSNITMDILLDDRRHAVRGVPMCGWWGILKSHSVWPFVAMDGELDLGDDGEAPVLSHKDRFAIFDMIDRIIAVGESFSLRYGDNWWTLRLEKLTDITDI